MIDTSISGEFGNTNTRTAESGSTSIDTTLPNDSLTSVNPTIPVETINSQAATDSTSQSNQSTPTQPPKTTIALGNIERSAVDEADKETKLPQGKSESDKVASLLARILTCEKEKYKQSAKQELYVAQAGDTLESIATLMLADVGLAELIYQLNKQKIALNLADGEIVYALHPKTVLLLPSMLQTNAWRQSRRPHSAKFKSIPPPIQNNHQSKVHAPKSGIRSTLVGNGPTLVLEDQDQRMGQAKNLINGASQASSVKPSADPQIEQLSSVCRIVKLDKQSDFAPKIIAKLEVLNDNMWTAIVTYEIEDRSSVRYQHKANGTIITLPIDLPAPAVQELMYNDLKSNWRIFTRPFLKRSI